MMGLAMMSRLLLVLSSVMVVTMQAATSFEAVEEWHLWKAEHGRQYSSFNEELEHHIIWLSNKKYIEEHNANADKFGYTLSLNRFGDLTSEEYKEVHTCYSHLTNNTTKSGRLTYQSFRPPKFLSLPDTVDWRTKDAVSDIKDQGQCGSCYAFSATGALEGAHALATDKMVPLSEQNVLDCSVPYGNHGCQGGNVHNAYEYVVDNQGIDTEASYPYKGKQGQCSFNKHYIGASQTGVVVIPKGSEDDLQAATATAGPISVSVDASSNAFRFYQGGVFDEPNCYNEASRLTHSMLIIGYGTYKNKAYWLVKNSWGTNWGMDGYIMMARGKGNQCGIATAATFPTL